MYYFYAKANVFFNYQLMLSRCFVTDMYVSVFIGHCIIAENNLFLVFCTETVSYGGQTVAETNKGVVEVLAVRLRTNIIIVIIIIIIIIFIIIIIIII